MRLDSIFPMRRCLSKITAEVSLDLRDDQNNTKAANSYSLLNAGLEEKCNLTMCII